jgi:hypothetical protein
MGFGALQGGSGAHGGDRACGGRLNGCVPQSHGVPPHAQPTRIPVVPRFPFLLSSLRPWAWWATASTPSACRTASPWELTA